MEVPVLQVWRRTQAGKGVARKLRARGRIPGVFYGGGENVPLELRPQDLLKILGAGENTIFRLIFDGDGSQERQALVRELQWDPIKDTLLHADLFRVAMDVEIRVSVPVVLEGVARAVTDAGGVVNQLLDELEVECLPGLIPHELTVDIAHLGIGDVLHVRDLQVPRGVRVLVDGDEVVASISGPAVEAPAALPTAEAQEAAAETEEA